MSGDSFSEEDLDYKPPRPQRKSKRKITPQLVASVDHAGLSSSNAANVILSTAHYLDIDPKDVAVSRATIHRQRRSMRGHIRDNVKNTFCANLADAFFVLHWDGKILPKWHGVDGEIDKLAMVLTNGSNTKILGVAEIKKGTAEEQFQAITKTIDDWEIEPFIKGICFDTTSVNTGEKSGTCKKLRDMFGGKILTLACRHHVLEVLLSGVYCSAMKEKSTSPDISLFVKFKSQWNSLDLSKIAPGISNSRIASCIDKESQAQLKSMIKTQLSIQKSPRKDYTELLELSLIFLGETTFKNKPIKVRLPGALHRARFMSRGIYSLKIFAFRNQIKLTGTLKIFYKHRK